MSEGSVDLTTLVLKVQTDADKATADIKQLKAELEKLKSTTSGHTTELKQEASAQGQATAKTKAAAAAVNQLDKEKRQLAGSAHGAAGAMGKFNGGVMDSVRKIGMLRGAIAAVGIGLLISKVIDLTKYIVNMAAEFQALDVRMKGVFQGDAGKAEVAGKWLQDFIIKTPFQLKDAQKAFIQFRAFGIDPMNGSLQAVADMTARLGGSQETLERITLALGKSFLKGKMQGYELRQMHMAGVPAADLLGKALGRTTDEIYAMARAGQLGRDKVELLWKEMGKLAAGQALAFVKTFIGSMSNLKDYIAIFAREVGLTSGLLDEMARTIVLVSEGITGVTKDKSAETFGKTVALAMNDLNDVLEKMVNDGSFKKMADSAITFAEAMSAVITSIKNVMPWLEKINWWYNKMGAGTFLNPATLVRNLSDVDDFMAENTGNYGERGLSVKDAMGFSSIEIDKSTIAQEKFNAALERAFGSVKEAQAYFKTSADTIKKMYENMELAGSGGVKLTRTMREMHQEELAAAEAKKKTETELALADAKQAEADADARESEEDRLELLEKQIKKIKEQRKELENIYKWSSSLHVDIPVSFTYGSSIGGVSPTTPGYEAANDQLLGFNGDAIIANFNAMSAAAELYRKEEDAYWEERGKKDAARAEAAFKAKKAYQTKEFQEYLDNLNKEEAAKLKANEKAAAKALKEREKAIRHEAIVLEKVFGSVVDNFMDMLINGFSSEGVKNALNDLISGVGSTFADELKKTLGEALASGDLGAFSLDTDKKKEGWQIGSGWTEAGIAIGMGMLQAGIKKQSAGQAAMGGAISGAIVGAQSGGWIGAIIGGIAGGAFGYTSVDPEGAEQTLEGIGMWPHEWLGYDLGRITDPLGLFEPGDNPTTTIETTTTGGRVETRDQGSTAEQRQMFLQEVLSIQNNMRESFRAALMVFRDASLFDLVTPFQGIPLVGGPPGENLLPGERQGSMEQVLRQLGEVELPETFQQDFAVAFQTGLENLGLAARGIEQLGEEIANLPWDERLAALMTVASALRKIKDLSEIDPMTEISMDSMAQFADYMADAGDNVALLSAGWENMSIAERAGELEKIGDIWADVLSNALQILGQLDQMQKQINATFDNAIESIRMGEMTTGGRRDYLTGRIDAGMADLRAADSAEEIQAAVDDVFKYINMLAQVLQEGYAAAARILSTTESLTDSILTANPLAMATRTPEQAYSTQMRDFASEVGSLGNTIWDPDSDIVEVANAVGRVNEIWQQALASTVEMLRAVEQARTQVNQLFDNAILTAQMNRMSPAQLQAFNQQRSAAALATINDPASTASQVAAASATYVELLVAEATARQAAIDSILETVDIFAELAEVNPLEDFAQSATEAFNEFMAESTASVNDLMAGFDDLTLEEQADRLRQIGDIWGGVLDNVMQMLQAIDQAQRAMNQQYDSARESLAMGGMDFNEQQAYLRAQIAGADERLHDPNISLEEAQAASDDLFRYIQMLQQLFESQGDRGMYEVGANGQTYADIIMDLLNQGQAESNRIFDDLRDNTQDALVTFETALDTATTALGSLGAMAAVADPWGDIIGLLTIGQADANAALSAISAELITRLQNLSLQIRDTTIGIEDIADVWTNEVAAAIIELLEAAQVEANARIEVVREGVIVALEEFRLAVLAARDALSDPIVIIDSDLIDNDDLIGDDLIGDVDVDDPNPREPPNREDPTPGQYDSPWAKSGRVARMADLQQETNSWLSSINTNTQSVPVVNIDINGSIAMLEPYVRAIVTKMTTPGPRRQMTGGIS